MKTYTLIANGKRVRLNAVMDDVVYTRAQDGADRNITIDAARADVYVEDDAPVSDVHALAQKIVDALVADEADGGFDLTAGLFGAEFSKLVRRWAALEAEHARTHA